MASITTRAGKGSPLTHAEVDANFNNLNNGKLDISTAPAGSITVDSSGRLGVGTSTPDRLLHLSSTTYPQLRMVYPGQQTWDTGVESTGFYSITRAGQSAAITVDTSNRVGIGTSSPTENLTIYGTSSRFAVTGGAGSSAILIGNQNGSGANNPSVIEAANGALYFGGGNSWSGGGTFDYTMTLTNDNKVGIGVTGPDASLTIASGASLTNYWTPAGLYSAKLGTVGSGQNIYAGITGTYQAGDSANLLLQARFSDVGTVNGVVLKNSATNAGGLAICSLTAANGGAVETERARIDSSGRLLVGTSSTSANTTLLLQGYNGGQTNAGGHLRLAIPTATPTSGANLGLVLFSDSEHTNCAYISGDRDGGTWSASSKPTRLVFSTTADGAASPTERMRISSAGVVTISSNVGSTTNLALIDNSYNVLGSQVLTLGNRANANNTSSYYLVCQEPDVANRCFIYGNGNIANTNNSYGALSDIKLKENIIDAASQWNDLKALRVRKYNFKEETKHQTHAQIGLIAQEVELVSPGLVYESPDRDTEGNDLGTVTKSVNYSVLYMKAVKALQEAMERIETLEAKVAALEASS